MSEPVKPTFAPLPNPVLRDLDIAFDGGLVIETQKARARPDYFEPGDPDPEPEYQVIFARPTGPQADTLRTSGASAEPTRKATAIREFARQTVVAVNIRGKDPVVALNGTSRSAVQAAFDMLLAKFPLIPEGCSKRMMSAAGAVAGAAEKE